MSTYLYGVIRQPSANSKLTSNALGNGVGDPPVPGRMIEHRDLAAIVSSVDFPIGPEAGAKALRRDMAAHSALQSRVLSIRTILPARFGMLLPNDRTVIDGF